MSIRQMLCTNTTKVQFCRTGRNLCTEAEVAIKCNVTLQGALHPSARGNDGAKKLVCVKQHWMKLKKKTWRPLSQDWKGRRSFAHQIFNYACTTVFRTNCNNLDKKHIPLPYLEKKSWRSATWGGGVQPPAYFILCILWCLSQKWFMHELCIKKKKRKKTNKQNPTLFTEDHQYPNRSPREVVESLPLEILKTQRDMALSNLLDVKSNGAGWDDLQRRHLNDPVILHSHWENLKDSWK